MLKKAIRCAVDHLRSSYELVGGVKHDGEKGAFREFFLANFLRPLLPHQFGVGSGVVVDASGNQSRQTDVIVYDRRRLPPLMLAGDRGLFPIDSVLVMIEVKSILKAEHLSEIVEAAKLVAPDGKLRIATPGTMEAESTFYPLFAVFAYESDAKEKDELTRLEEQSPGGKDLLRVLCVLDKGVWAAGKLHLRSTERHENATSFLVSIFNRIEEASSTRGKYRLQDWLQG